MEEKFFMGKCTNQCEGPEIMDTTSVKYVPQCDDFYCYRCLSEDVAK